MFRKLVFILIILFSTHAFSQENKLLGKWILDKITYSNGNALEINHPLYSTKTIIYISPNSLIINGIKNEVKFQNNQLIINNRAQDIIFSNSNLIFNASQDNLKYYYLKEKDFLLKYPEFRPNTITKDDQEIFLSNEIIEPIYFNKLDFTQSFLQNFTKKYLDSYNKNFDFSIQFFIDEKNKISQIEIIGEELKDTDIANIKNTFKTSEPNFINTYGKKILLKYNFKFGLNVIDKNQDSHKNLNFITKVRSYYDNNEFNKVIETFEKLDKETYSRIYNKNLLAISYLATNQTQKACNTFFEIGDITNYQVRNYIKNFCQKN